MFSLNTLRQHLGIDLQESTSDVGINVGINDTLTSDSYEQRIITLIANSPKVSVADMAEMLGISDRQCERIIAQMKKDGFLRRVGAKKNGHWEIG